VLADGLAADAKQVAQLENRCARLVLGHELIDFAVWQVTERVYG
jgi:hypothetical protein